MTAVTINLPEKIYDRLQRLADASRTTIEDVVLRTIESGMPPGLSKVPARFHDDLLALNALDDDKLWQVVMGKLGGNEHTDSEAKKADWPTLRRAYAFALLKWRGHPVPASYDILVE